jgi:hypothetical protein
MAWEHEGRSKRLSSFEVAQAQTRLLWQGYQFRCALSRRSSNNSHRFCRVCILTTGLKKEGREEEKVALAIQVDECATGRYYPA